MTRVGVICAIVAVATAGCIVGPNYRTPELETPKQWAEERAAPAAMDEATLVSWWQVFDDPVLNDLIARSVESNYDLQAATARVREARALHQAAISAFFPTVDTSTFATRNRRSRNSLNFPVEQLDTDLYDAEFDASWELDLFGGKERSAEAALADVQAAVENRRDVLVSLTAEVARNYVELRGFQQRLATAEDNLGAQQEAVEITEARFHGGLSSELDAIQARALLAGIRAEIPQLETSIRQAIYRLGVLVGGEPEALADELGPPAAIPAAPPSVPAGLPSELLRRRPDIRRSERQLAAATARIGVQTAELFPKLTLTGTAGLQSLSASDLFTAGSRYWTAGPTLSWRVFDAGRIRAGIEAAKARTEQAAAGYAQTVYGALQEVEAALVEYANERVRYGALADAVTQNRQAVDLGNELYTRGLGDFLSVLVAERALYVSEDDLVASQANVSAAVVALYKALGGGWEE